MRSYNFIPILTDFIITARVVVYICVLDKEPTTIMFAAIES